MTLISAENQAKSWLHEKATRHHGQHESHSGGLAGGGWRRVQASKRDSLSGCELHWSLPLLNVGPEGETSASRDSCHVAGFVCIDLLFQIHFQACSVQSGKEAACWIAGNLRRSTLQRWQSLFTSQMTLTPRSKCWEWNIWCLKCSPLIWQHQPLTSFSRSTSFISQLANKCRTWQWWVFNNLASCLFTRSKTWHKSKCDFQYLGELSLVDSDPFLKYLPSQTAAAAFVLANNTMTSGSWVSLKWYLASNMSNKFMFEMKAAIGLHLDSCAIMSISCVLLAWAFTVLDECTYWFRYWVTIFRTCSEF